MKSGRLGRTLRVSRTSACATLLQPAAEVKPITPSSPIYDLLIPVPALRPFLVSFVHNIKTLLTTFTDNPQVCGAPRCTGGCRLFQ